MCLGVPAEVVALLDDDWTTVDMGGVRKKISTALLEEVMEIGDYVIVHVGSALCRIDPEKAQQTLVDMAGEAKVAV